MSYMPVVIDAEYISDYKISITFDNGEKKIADFSRWLNGEIFEPLKGQSLLSKVFCGRLDHIVEQWR